MDANESHPIQLVFILVKGRQQHAISTNGNHNIRMLLRQNKIIFPKLVAQLLKNLFTLTLAIANNGYFFTCSLHLCHHYFQRHHLTYDEVDQTGLEPPESHPESLPSLHPRDKPGLQSSLSVF